MARIKINLRSVMLAANRYADARVAKAFEGTIPVLSDDPEEQEFLDAAHAVIAEDLERTEQALRRAVENLVLRYIED